LRVSRPPSVDTLAPGQRIGPFVLLAPMGVGGSGRIWAVARIGQLGFSKRMALKVMRHDKLSSSRARDRFDREACLGARLNHANVRAVHDLGDHEGRPFMAMSWVDTSLAELLEHASGHALDADVVCWIGMQCCSALSAAHSYMDPTGEPNAIVHRDVSPGNILLTADGHALLADLAAPPRDPRSSPHAGATPERRFFGSLAYAAPEALRQESLDGRSDLFSLGCVLYEALAGAPAFEGDDEPSVVFHILERGAPDLGQRLPHLSKELVLVVHRCLERQPERRFQSAAELCAALSACCRHASAFRLEQRTSEVVREVLGSRIQAREEAMHLAFQRFAPSSLERTDTLPIARAAADGGGTALSVVPAPLAPDGIERDRATSHSGVPVAISRRSPLTRRQYWALGVVATPLVLYGLYRSLGADASERASPGTPMAEASRALPPPAPKLELEIVRALESPPAAAPTAAPPAPGSGGSPSTAGAASEAVAPPPSEVTGRPNPDSASEGSPRRRALSRAGNPAGRARDPAAPEREPGEAPARAEPKPFIFHYDGDNPYDGSPASPPAGRARAPVERGHDQKRPLTPSDRPSATDPPGTPAPRVGGASDSLHQVK
jgi:serine/threonine protein kinase